MDAIRDPALRLDEPRSAVAVEYASDLHVLGALLAGQLDPARLDTVAVRGAGAVGWPNLIALAQAHKTGPLLLAAVQAAGLEPERDPSWQPLFAERRHAAMHSLLVRDVQRTVQRALEAAEIPVLWLKGVVLAVTVYPAPELRPMVDVDALVPYDERARALAVVEAAGFQRSDTALFDGTEGLKHHYHLCGGPGNVVQVELHFRLLGAMDRLLPVARLAWFWEHTQAQAVEGMSVRVLQPEAHLLYLCAHALMQHGEAGLQLLRIYDLHRLITQTSAFRWELMVDGASRLGWTYAVERALAICAEYFATPVPGEVTHALHERRADAEDRAHVERRQQGGTLTEVVWGDLAAMGWRDRARSTVRIVAPPPDYMRRRYALASNRQLPLAYARRLAHISRNVAATIRQRMQRRV